jgi:hypothetical protein
MGDLLGATVRGSGDWGGFAFELIAQNRTTDYADRRSDGSSRTVTYLIAQNAAGQRTHHTTGTGCCTSI